MTIESPLVPLSLHHFGLRVDLGDGRKHLFVLDTGAGVTVVDRAFVAPLAEGFSALTAIGGAGGETVGSLAAVSLHLDGASQPLEEIAALSDLAVLRRYLHEDVIGIVGPGFWARYVVDIDLGARMLRLHGDDFLPPEGAIAIPLESLTNMRIPVVKAHVGDLGEVLMGIDSGVGTAIAMIAPDNTTLRLLPGKRVQSPARWFSGNFEAELGKGLSLQLGGLQLDSLPYLVSRKRGTASLREAGLAGVIGMNAVAGPKSRWIFNRKQRTLWLVPDLQPATRDRAGLIFVLEQGHLLVDGVIPTSAAAEAGFREGDEFAGIVGYEAMQRHEVVRAFAQDAGTHLDVLVRRGEDKQLKTISLTLRDYPYFPERN